MPNPFSAIGRWFGYSRNGDSVNAAPEPSHGLLDYVNRFVGQYPGPEGAAIVQTLRSALGVDGTLLDEITEQQVRRGPQGIVLPNFLPYLDEMTSGTGETATIRRTYRLMLADANIKAALYGKLFAVAAMDLKFHPASKKSTYDQKLADFARWTFNDVLGGPPKLVQEILLPGLIDGYGVAEKVLGPPEQKGRWRGKAPLEDLASIDYTDVIPQTDDRKRVVDWLGLRYNAGKHFHPALFVHWAHMPLFGQPTGVSDFRAAYRPYWIADTAWKLWLLMLQLRAGGLLKGKWTNEARRPSLIAALKVAKTHGWIVLPEGTDVEVLNMAAGGPEVFEAAMKAAKHDIFLCIEGAILQSLEGETTEGRGDTQIHKSTAELRRWWLARALERILNGWRNPLGLIRDVIDMNYVADEYPKASLASADINEIKARLEIYTGAKALGLSLSEQDVRENLAIESPDPNDPNDVLKGGEPENGEMGAPPSPSGGALDGAPAPADFAEWDESARKRGQPGNAGQFGPGGASDRPKNGSSRAAHEQRKSGVGDRLRSFAKASWGRLKGIGHGAHQIGVVAEEFVKDKIKENVQKLPSRWQHAVIGGWKMLRVASQPAFATYLFGQHLAETTAQEAGASPEQGARLKRICTLIDLTGAKAIPLTLHALGAGEWALASAFVPFGSLTYLAYSTATKPLAVLRGARKAVRDAAFTLAGLFQAAEKDASLERLMQAIGEHEEDADFFDACLCVALEQADDLDEALDLAEEATGRSQDFAEWDSSKHSRGQPDNPGQFTGKGNKGDRVTVYDPQREHHHGEYEHTGPMPTNAPGHWRHRMHGTRVSNEQMKAVHDRGGVWQPGAIPPPAVLKEAAERIKESQGDSESATLTTPAGRQWRIRNGEDLREFLYDGGVLPALPVNRPAAQGAPASSRPQGAQPAQGAPPQRTSQPAQAAPPAQSSPAAPATRPVESGFKDYRKLIEFFQGDSVKAADFATEKIRQHLAAGGSVSLWHEGKQIPIVQVSGNKVLDAKNQPWGLTALAFVAPGKKTGIEFHPPQPAQPGKRHAEDAAGHEHKGKGPGGGQFTSGGSGGGPSPQGGGQDPQGAQPAQAAAPATPAPQSAAPTRPSADSLHATAVDILNNRHAGKEKYARVDELVRAAAGLSGADLRQLAEKVTNSPMKHLRTKGQLLSAIKQHLSDILLSADQSSFSLGPDSPKV